MVKLVPSSWRRTNVDYPATEKLLEKAGADSYQSYLRKAAAATNRGGGAAICKGHIEKAVEQFSSKEMPKEHILLRQQDVVQWATKFNVSIKDWAREEEAEVVTPRV